MSVSREAGKRAKVAVKSNNPSIGAVGTCVGQMGGRIQAVIKELGNEKIDVLEWDQDPKRFIANALKPIKSNIAFDRLQRMREASKTGGALGNVSNIELDLLANSLGNIEQTSDPQVFYRNLVNIERIYTKILNDPVAFSLQEASSEEEFDRLLAEYRNQVGEAEEAGAANFSVGGQTYKIRPKR